MKCSKCGKKATASNSGVSNAETKKALCYKCLDIVLAPYLK